MSAYAAPPTPPTPPATPSRAATLSAISAHLLALGQPESGSDSESNSYPTLASMWQTFRPLSAAGTPAGSWYSAAAAYWENEANCATDINGMLGGFAQLSPPDVRGSASFLARLREKGALPAPLGPVADIGAGIGRVTRDLLLPFGFPRVDLVEVSPRLSQASPDFVGEGAGRCRFFNVGMQDFEPRQEHYSCIWIQWVIGHLEDVDCVAFLSRCLRGLSQGGLLCVKDNTCTGTTFIVDTDDSSVTRSQAYLEKLFDLAGAEIVEKEIQTGFPEEIYPVPMYALRVKSSP
ncbi:hypothetical protein TeGR_g9132 [Tetraparma gracilis]|uniref:Alpha N-terminal protein methyltransferase 1 n=1 Tax=Tetraparma gracilis TaxID=2962635 RepID=A0ABQ6M9H1_9STRA|nr:hypothetical protein TeGR_g9132 [Tetraparma gracilis]